MTDPSRTIQGPDVSSSIAADTSAITTFDWRGLHLHVATSDALTPDQARTIERALRWVESVGQFADLLGMVLGRRVRITTERPSADIRLDVG